MDPACVRSVVFGIIALLMLALGASPWAAASEQVAPSCAEVIESQARLACYDALHPPSAAVRAAVATRGVDQFGKSSRRDVDAMPTPTPERLQATVVAVVQQPGATRRVELDSGQHWLITEATTRGPLFVGDRVGLRKAALGSYMLVTPAGVTLRARRIR